KKRKKKALLLCLHRNLYLLYQRHIYVFDRFPTVESKPERQKTYKNSKAQSLIWVYIARQIFEYRRKTKKQEYSYLCTGRFRPKRTRRLW
ncbi:unnamed protein product, partial [Ixodes persulcatus]